MGIKKYSIEQIREALESEGYQLLTTEYKNSRQKIDFICPNGHKHNIRWDCWKENRRCGICFGNKGKVTYENIKESFDSEGYHLISKEYVNMRTKLDFICNNGHIHSITGHEWRKGQRCGKCMSVTIEYIKDKFEQEGYALISSTFINAHTKLKFICPKGHTHSIAWSQWKIGQRCAKCRTSKPEHQLLNYIKFAYPHLNVVHNDRSQIINPNTKCYLEFDIWLPELNKAIEMDGIAYHHSSWNTTNDVLKNQLCKEKGIPLLRITDEEWYTSDIIRTKIHKFILD